jgi:hypothetical protein
MAPAGFAERGQPRDQCDAMGFDFVITLAKTRASAARI